MAVSKREKLVETALKLFCSGGFHATGIDRILAESGVAKMTLYNHFKSKDELILAALRLRDERWRHWFERAVERGASDPNVHITALKLLTRSLGRRGRLSEAISRLEEELRSAAPGSDMAAGIESVLDVTSARASQERN